MKLKTAFASTLMSVGLLLTQVVMAVPYFRCPDGFDFVLNQRTKGVHCSRNNAAVTGPIICPSVPTQSGALQTSAAAQARQDVCVGQFVQSGRRQPIERNPLPCPNGFDYVLDLNGLGDRCVRPAGWEFIPPSVRFED